MRAATLVGHARLDLDLTAWQELDDHRGRARADVAYAKTDATAVSRRQGCSPTGFAFERVQHLDRPRAPDALAGDARLAIVDRVTPPQLDRIEPELLGNHVDVALAGEHRLRIARRAHRSARDAVGVDGLHFEPRHRYVVGGERVMHRHDQVRRDLTSRIRAAIND